MLTNDNKRKKSVFIFDVTFDENFVRYFSKFYQCYHFKYKNRFSKLLQTILLFMYFCFFKIFNKILVIYGQDHVDAAKIFFSKIFTKWKFYLLEDGAGNYVNIEEIKKHSKNYNYLVMGFNNRIEKIILTTTLKVDRYIRNKVVRVNLLKLWEKKSLKEKNIIKILYNLNDYDLSNYKNCIITQPFARNGMMTYQEQLDLYRKIFYRYSPKNTFIKVHPLDDFLYNIYFPEYYIINGNIPMELLLLMNLSITKIITVNSSVTNFNRKNITVEYFDFDGNVKY